MCYRQADNAPSQRDGLQGNGSKSVKEWYHTQKDIGLIIHLDLFFLKKLKWGL